LDYSIIFNILVFDLGWSMDYKKSQGLGHII